MALRKVEARKIEAKVKPSHADAYDENGKPAKGMAKKLDVGVAPPSNGHSAKNGTSAAEAPVRGRPGRKPKVADPSGNGADAVPEAVDSGDDTADPSVQIVEKMSATKLRAKDRRAKEKALKEALERSYHGTEEDLETRRNKLKALIKLGKDRGFLTYAEINDHLPEGLVEAEAIEAIIGTFSDMGIAVFDQAPDADTLLMADRRWRRPTMTPRKKPKPRSPLSIPSSVAPRTRAHVHARNGLGGAADARRRDRNRQEDRGRPQGHDAGDFGLPDDDRGNPRCRRSHPCQAGSVDEVVDGLIDRSRPRDFFGPVAGRDEDDIEDEDEEGASRR